MVVRGDILFLLDDSLGGRSSNGHISFIEIISLACLYVVFEIRVVEIVCLVGLIVADSTISGVQEATVVFGQSSYFCIGYFVASGPKGSFRGFTWLR